MPFFASAAATGSRRGGRPIRLALVLLSVLLVHLLAIEWVAGRIGLPGPAPRKEPELVTELLPPPNQHIVLPHAQHSPPHPPHPPKAHKPVARKPRPARPAAPRRKSPAPAPAPAPVASPAPEPPESLADAMAADPAAQADAIAYKPPSSPPVPELAYKFNPPPPAELDYDVFAWREQQKWYGSGKFLWQAGDDGYRIDGEASITFFFKITVLNFHSEGAIDDYGIAPRVYSEQPFRKPVSRTSFRANPDGLGGTLGFSATDAAFPYHVGAQDRASVLWQLAGIGCGDPEQFRPGARLDLMVAGIRDVETWQIEVAGLEAIETDYGKMQAWHLVRTPRPGSGEQKIDIWLAPDHDWYPARVRYTYADGDYLELALTDLAPLAPQQ